MKELKINIIGKTPGVARTDPISLYNISFVLGLVYICIKTTKCA